eukprot:5050994-Heterocapsa_arctica.AAC.1
MDYCPVPICPKGHFAACRRIHERPHHRCGRLQLCHRGGGQDLCERRESHLRRWDPRADLQRRAALPR